MTLLLADAWLGAVDARVLRVFAAKRAIDPEWQPEICVPKVSFVRAGLAIVQGDKSQSAFLIEEHIGGSFEKFINNDSAALQGDAVHDPLCQFLSYTQHAQYI